MSLNFLYIDENLASHDHLSKLLDNIETVNTLYCFDTLKKAHKHLSENNVDVIIIDPNFTKEAGFSFIEKRLKNHFFILHSARTKDAVKGYELGLFDFLPKPLLQERLLMAINRLKKQEYVVEKQRSILPRSYIEVRCDLMKERIAHEHISHVVAMGDYVKIVTDKRKYVVLMSMKKIEELLPQEIFFRSHKSFIINTKKIHNFTAKEISLKEIKVPLSRFRKQAFIAIMQTA